MTRDRLPAPPVEDLLELLRLVARRAVRKPVKLPARRPGA
jgi:hypothetical protein